MITQRMTEMTEALCQAMGCAASVEIQHLTEPVVNHPDVTERLHGVFAPVIGAERIITDERTMAGEDMYLYMKDVPGAFFLVGSARTGGETYGHHHPRFDIDEDVLPLAAALLTSAVADYVLRED
jgi:amidohydrolase